MQESTVEALGALVGGTVRGDGTVQIRAARPISEADAGDITFAEDEQYARKLKQSRASAAVVRPEVEIDGLPLICVPDPLEAFATIFDHLEGPTSSQPPGINPRSCISPTARLGQDASVGPFVTIADDVTIGHRCRLMAGVYVGDRCQLGDDVVLHPNVVLYPGTVLRDRVIVHAGAVLGADGFGYRQREGRHVKVPQFGHLEVGDDVEIGAGTTIDRGTFHVTRIGQGTKIDNLVQIAHNCQIGRHNVIVSQVGIAGSTKTGDYVIIAGQAGIREHLTIGEGAVVGAMSGVLRDVPAGARVVGIPATSDREQYRLQATMRNLPEKLRAFVRQIESLKQDRRSA